MPRTIAAPGTVELAGTAALVILIGYGLLIALLVVAVMALGLSGVLGRS